MDLLREVCSGFLAAVGEGCAGVDDLGSKVSLSLSLLLAGARWEIFSGSRDVSGGGAVAGSGGRLLILTMKSGSQKGTLCAMFEVRCPHLKLIRCGWVWGGLSLVLWGGCLDN